MPLPSAGSSGIRASLHPPPPALADPSTSSAPPSSSAPHRPFRRHGPLRTPLGDSHPAHSSPSTPTTTEPRTGHGPLDLELLVGGAGLYYGSHSPASGSGSRSAQLAAGNLDLYPDLLYRPAKIRAARRASASSLADDLAAGPGQASSWSSRVAGVEGAEGGGAWDPGAVKLEGQAAKFKINWALRQVGGAGAGRGFLA